MLQRQFRDVGVDMKVQLVDGTSISALWFEGNFDAMLHWWQMPADPELTLFFAADRIPPHGRNINYFEDEPLTKLVYAADRTVESRRTKAAARRRAAPHRGSRAGAAPLRHHQARCDPRHAPGLHRQSDQHRGVLERPRLVGAAVISHLAPAARFSPPWAKLCAMRLLCSVALALLLAVPAVAQPAATQPATAQDAARLEDFVQAAIQKHNFMGAVLVARGDEILLNKGYGQANTEWNIPNTPATKFRLGSLTKQFTAASILLLEERGKLAITDPVSKHLPDAPAAWSAITLHHLLTHSSGIPNFTSLPEYAKFQPFPTTVEATIAVFRDKPLDFAPGDRMSYSNSGYLLLGHLIERISGQSYETFLKTNILDPLAMNDTGLDSNATIIPRRAAGYTSGPNGLANAGFIHMSVPHAAGAMYSTTEDLLRWERGLFGGKVVSDASLRKMTTPFKNNYALGVSVVTLNGKTRIVHGGGIQGFNTALSYDPDARIVVVVLANVNGPAADTLALSLMLAARGEAISLPKDDAGDVTPGK